MRESIVARIVRVADFGGLRFKAYIGLVLK